MISNRKPSWKHLALGIPAAVASLCGAAAKADTSLLEPIKFYGFINGEVEAVKADGGTTPYAARGRVTDGNSRVGASGGITISPTTHAIWQLEASLNSFDQGGVNDIGQSSTLTSRNSYVGIEDTRFGRIVVGNNDSAYRTLIGSGGAMGGNLGLSTLGLDLWNNTSAQLTGNSYSLFSRGEARYKNSVHATSAEFAGFQAAASLGFDEARSNGVAHTRFSLAGKYTHGPLQIGIGYDQQSNTGADIDNQQNGYGFRTTGQQGATTHYAKLVASYTFPTHTYLGIGVEQASYGFAQFVPPSGTQIYPLTITGNLKQVGIMGSIAQDIGNATLMLSGGQLGNLNNAVVGKPGDYQATQFSLGAKYRINEYLSAYAYGTYIKNKTQQSVNLGQDPLYSVGTGSTGAYLSPGDSPQAVGIGLIARF